ncbi:uncharacterized protein FIBRA_06483 [Fibroporia radiculosa]|uniref:Uncharacterized protein n=1 Tax=Fibroporia radiculosa TaxID=599839 RepID=J4HZ66_9APHY|nr:uncharacterized protein FIBRA_06483 [Fibroporia radiculosa]CCM04312.1 predicted protein [Fibroporia radiculosa]
MAVQTEMAIVVVGRMPDADCSRPARSPSRKRFRSVGTRRAPACEIVIPTIMSVPDFRRTGELWFVVVATTVEGLNGVDDHIHPQKPPRSAFRCAFQFSGQYCELWGCIPNAEVAPDRRGKSLGPTGTKTRDADNGPHATPPDTHHPPLPTTLHNEAKEMITAPSAQVESSSSRRPWTTGSDGRPTVVVEEASQSDGHGEFGGGSIVPRLRQTRSEGGSIKGMRARAMSLPRQVFRTNASPDSSSQPSPCTPGQAFQDFTLVRVAENDRPNFRDSVLTHISSTSSSLYPASTITGSHTESSLPYSPDEDSDRMRAFTPEIVSPEKSDFDADDVSYRLRLLVNNSYFLPPAHAKPSPLSLAPPDAAVSKKSPNKTSNSAFLDFFRIGKSKSKPTTPVSSAGDGLMGPVLRTTSDSTTVSGFVSRPPAHSLPQTPIHVLPLPSSMTRVVVVREKMEDLVVAAKQAEEDLKTRATIRKARSQSIPRVKDWQVDVIDPTDAVDLPPPPVGSIPFAVQTSAAYGLGIRDSIGAAVLAEQLPPNSPGLWSFNSDEDSWRKALLREAVSHSLSNSADISYATTSTDRSPFPSPTSPSMHTSSAETSDSLDVPTQSTPRHRIGQQIMPPQELTVRAEVEVSHSPTTPTQYAKAPMSGSSLVAFLTRSPAGTVASWPFSNSPPGRAETPAQTHPLAPAPRRQLGNPHYSLSQPDLSNPSMDEQLSLPGPSRSSPQALRKAVSSPGLSDAHGGSVGIEFRAMSLSPPPMSISQRLSAHSSVSVQDLRPTPSFSSNLSAMSQARISDDDLSYATPADTDVDQAIDYRPSVTVSLTTENRPSLSISDYSHPSPTASAFHDAIFGSCRAPSVLSRRSYEPEEFDSSSEAFILADIPAPLPRAHVASPPPRVSSSANHTVLPPPPRSPAAKPVYRPSISSRASTDPGHKSSPLNPYSSHSDPPQNSSIESFATPVSAIALSERRGQASLLSLRIPTEFMPAAIHSAPAPASPTEFFDRIEATMELDELDESDEEEPTAPPAAVYSRSRARADSDISSTSIPRPPFMRLGNHSTPQLGPPSLSDEPSSPMRLSESRKPVSNIPERPRRGSFFSHRKKGLTNKDIPLLSFADLASSSQGSRPDSNSGGRASARRRPATANDAETKPKQPQRESLLMFDGMLVRHMEAEKDRIRQITSNMSGSGLAKG